MNQSLFFYLNNFAGQSKFLDDLTVFFGQYFAYILVMIFLLIVLKNKNWRLLIVGGISAFFSRIVITEIIRFFYNTPRPFLNSGPIIHQLIFHETSGSFPSGHTAFFFALAMAIYFFYKKWGIAFFVSALLMGIARIIAGVHWPIDILGGAIIGFFSAWIVNKIYKRYTF
jgi:undecaprenyl-diphosphatase